MENVTEEKTVLQWHPAFYAGLQIELAEEAHLLEFENEHQLGTKPKEIDVLVIKKDAKTVIRKNIGRIFRMHNIIEYKSPTDDLQNGEQTEELLQDYQKHKNEGLYESMMDIIVNANANTFKEERKMSGALMRLMQDTIDEEVDKRVSAKIEEHVAKERDKQIEFAVSLVRDGILSAAEAAKRLFMSEEEFVQKMNACSRIV